MMRGVGPPGSLFEAIWRLIPGRILMADERRSHPRKASLIPVAYVTEGKARRNDILNVSSGQALLVSPVKCPGRKKRIRREPSMSDCGRSLG
jgi:hypothetical protein